MPRPFHACRGCSEPHPFYLTSVSYRWSQHSSRPWSHFHNLKKKVKIKEYALMFANIHEQISLWIGQRSCVCTISDHQGEVYARTAQKVDKIIKKSSFITYSLKELNENKQPYTSIYIWCCNVNDPQPNMAVMDNETRGPINDECVGSDKCDVGGIMTEIKRLSGAVFKGHNRKIPYYKWQQMVGWGHHLFASKKHDACAKLLTDARLFF